MEPNHIELDLSDFLPAESECPECAVRLKQALETEPGVGAVDLDLKTDRLNVSFDPLVLTTGRVVELASQQRTHLSEIVRHERLPLAGLDCADCARTLERSLSEMAGVTLANVNFAAGTLFVEYRPETVGLPALVARIESLGYQVREEQQEQTVVFRVEGMDCADCARKLEGIVGDLRLVTHADVNFGAGLLKVTHAGDPEIVREVRSRVAEAGYHAHLADEAVQPEGSAPPALWRRLLPQGGREIRTAISALALLVGALVHFAGAPELAAIPFFALSIVVGGWSIARAGWAALRTTRNVDMNVLMSIAVIGAAVIGQWFEGATVVVLFSIGNLLEARTMDRARRSIRGLMDLSPKTAILIHGDHEERVLVDELKVGDRIVVRPGERIPMDGQVAAGHSRVNQAPITGESAAVDKADGDEVYAGTINGEGALELVVSRLASDNTLARIVQMVEQAQAQRAPSQRWVDRFSAIYTPAVIALAVLVAVVPPLFFGQPFSSWLYRALMLLVISCPCALVLSTPVTIVSAISRAARQGILIKGGAYLEQAGALRAVAFDKTGTITTGRPHVTDVVSLNGYGPDQLLSIASTLEEHSEHSLGEAIVAEARRRGVAGRGAGDFQAVAGQGATGSVGGIGYLIGSPRMLRARVPLGAEADATIERLQGQGRTVALLARAGAAPEVVGIIALADETRSDAGEAIRRLKAAGIEHTVMLTGDHARTAQAVADQVGVDEVRADLLPEQKVDAVQSLLEQYGAVAMVGDGVNDAPALALASLGIAMGAVGTDVALETADIALMSDDLGKVATSIRLGRRARRVVTQNIVFALLLKLVFLGLAVSGLATLWMAVFADVGASLLVTLNGMRLLAGKEGE